MGTEGRSCAGCLNWQRLEGDRGECRAHAPRPTGLRLDAPLCWPPMLASQWCGDFRPLPVVQGKSSLPPPVEVFYRNHRGEEGWRRVSVLAVRFGVAVPWHAEPQPLLEVWDHGKRAARTLALACCQLWRAVEGGGA